MLGPQLVFFVTAVVYLCNTGIYASSSTDNMKKLESEMYPIFEDCLKEYGATEKTNYEDLNPCIWACFFKKTELMDNKGYFDQKKYTEINKIYLTNKEDLAKIDKIRQECEKVNDAEVSDGDKGCERSKLMIDCVKEQVNAMA